MRDLDPRKTLATPAATIPRERKVGGGPSRQDIKDPIKIAVMEKLSTGRPMSVADLIGQLASVGNERSEIASKLRELEDEGIVELAESSGQITLSRYMTSPQSIWFLASLWIIVATFLTLLVPPGLPLYSSIPLMYLRYSLGGLLVLYLPGFALMSAVYPHKSNFDELARVAISIAMSLAIGVLIGLVLAVSPIGLTTGSTTVSLGIFTVVVLLVALKRRFEFRYVSRGI